MVDGAEGRVLLGAEVRRGVGGGGGRSWGTGGHGVADGEDHAQVPADCAQAGGDGAGAGCGCGGREGEAEGGERQWWWEEGEEAQEGCYRGHVGGGACTGAGAVGGGEDCTQGCRRLQGDGEGEGEGEVVVLAVVVLVRDDIRGVVASTATVGDAAAPACAAAGHDDDDATSCGARARCCAVGGGRSASARAAPSRGGGDGGGRDERLARRRQRRGARGGRRRRRAGVRLGPVGPRHVEERRVPPRGGAGRRGARPGARGARREGRRRCRRRAGVGHLRRVHLPRARPPIPILPSPQLRRGPLRRVAPRRRRLLPLAARPPGRAQPQPRRPPVIRLRRTETYSRRVLYPYPYPGRAQIRAT